MKFFWLRFLHPYIICALATLGPVGYWGRAPGTWGSVAGLFFYVGCLHKLNSIAAACILAVLAYFAIGICDAAQRIMHTKDPGYIILDECVAIPWVFIGLKDYLGSSKVWLYWILGLILFRFFDIVKPLSIKKLQDLPGGLGVVADDIAAALVSALCLHTGLMFFNYFY